ncbi:MAG: adenylate/guanylate cyclase domain-containing protein [Vampirovibrionales bacterium]|nr:adenylate/guanylate cyclase domain-containing protein [Vampirovibrionales bacterium]
MGVLTTGFLGLVALLLALAAVTALGLTLAMRLRPLWGERGPLNFGDSRAASRSPSANPWQSLYPYWSAAQATLPSGPPLPVSAMAAGGASYQGAMREVTVLCCDIRGYTAMVSQYPPHWIVEQLNEFLSGMTGAIFQHQGRLDKYMGDGLLAYFEPADGTVASSAVNAATAALRMMDELARLNQQWRQRGLPAMEIGVGLHCGPVYIGSVGSHMRMDVTILGDAVNVASRLEALNKRFGTRIVVSDPIRQWIQGAFRLRALGKVAIRGKSQPESVFALTGVLDASARRDCAQAI